MNASEQKQANRRFFVTMIFGAFIITLGLYMHYRVQLMTLVPDFIVEIIAIFAFIGLLIYLLSENLLIGAFSLLIIVLLFVMFPPLNEDGTVMSTADMENNNWASGATYESVKNKHYFYLGNETITIHEGSYSYKTDLSYIDTETRSFTDEDGIKYLISPNRDTEGLFGTVGYVVVKNTETGETEEYVYS